MTVRMSKTCGAGANCCASGTYVNIEPWPHQEVVILVATGRDFGHVNLGSGLSLLRKGLHICGARYFRRWIPIITSIVCILRGNGGITENCEVVEDTNIEWVI